MGVMECSRIGCDEILCDTHISGIGHICNECKEDFKTYLKGNNLTPITNSGIKLALGIFMDNYKDSDVLDYPECIDEYFNQNS